MGLFAVLLNNSFTVQRQVRIDNGQGGWAIAYADAGSVAGRLRPASGAERTVALQEQRAITHVLYVRAGEDIQRDDLVTGDEVTVRVQGIREPSRADHHLEIDCLETQKGATEEPGS